MRKIDKSTILATAYHTWVDALEAEGKEHGKYSSNHRFYRDIFMNILHCQGGICAYTEEPLCNIDSYDDEYWKSGRYIGAFAARGNLEHFNPKLKKNQGWLWDNFFIVNTDVNVKVKREKEPNLILKPDLPNYDPFKLLDYDSKRGRHFFTANNMIEDEDLINNIENSIIILGLNWEPIVDHRRKYLTEKFKDIQMKKKTIVEARAELYQFFTAFEMMLQTYI